jgi:hypothetical protein
MSYPPPPEGQQPGSGPYGQGQQPPHGQQPPYGQPGYGQPGYGYGPRQDHPKAMTSLVLGILGLVICTPIAPFAWRIGKRAVDEIDASGGQWGGRSTAKAGYVLGLIGTILLIIGVLAFVLVLVVGGLGAMTQSQNL